MFETAMTPRYQRKDLSEPMEEIAKLTISNGMCSQAGSVGTTNQKTLTDPTPSTQDQRPYKNEEPRVLRLDQVIEKIGLSRSSIYNLIDDGNFPQRVKLSKRAIGFYEHEIDAWILQLVRKA